MGTPEGFAFSHVGGEVVITHHGRRAGVLRGSAANRFLAEVEGDEEGSVAQELMARVTGNYKHGNERSAREHPRNRGR